MNILIRNVPKSIDTRLCELAKKAGKSKQAFLLEQIRQIALYPELKELSDKYSNSISEICQVVTDNTNIIKQLLEDTENAINKEDEGF